MPARDRILTLIDAGMWPLMLVFAASIILSIAVVQTVAILLTVFLVVKLMIARTFRWRKTPFDLVYLAFVMGRILTIVFSTDWEASVVAFSKEIVYYGLFFVITQEFPFQDERKVRLIVWVLVASAVVASIYGSMSYLAGKVERATSTVSGPVTLGMYLTAVIPFVLVMGNRREFFPKRWLWPVVTGVLVIGIVCTLNRIHWGILTLILVALGLVRDRKLLAFLAVGGILVVLSPPIMSRLESSATGISELMNGRDVIWLDGLEQLTDHPLAGFGPRTFNTVFRDYDRLIDKRVGSWHNDYLQVYMESGLVGLIPFLWLMVLVFRHGIKSWRAQSKGTSGRDFMLALLLSMGAFYAAGLVGGFVIDPLNSLLQRFLMALLALSLTPVAPAR